MAELFTPITHRRPQKGDRCIKLSENWWGGNAAMLAGFRCAACGICSASSGFAHPWGGDVKATKPRSWRCRGFSGIRPYESKLSTARYQKSPVQCTRLRCFGAENGIRTRDLDLGKVALYQLSYFRVGAANIKRIF